MKEVATDDLYILPSLQSWTLRKTSRNHQRGFPNHVWKIFSPPNRFSVRTSNGGFAKSKEKDLRAHLDCRKLKEGFKNWAAKRKLEFEKSSGENKPPSKCLTLSLPRTCLQILLCPTLEDFTLSNARRFYSV